jgi:hypothetical protein
MPAFITHVELLDATENDYQKLHITMKNLQFFNTIQDILTGLHYRLPANTFYSLSEEDASFVLSLARTAAKKTRRNYTAFTVQSGGIQFTGLEIISNPD